MQISRSYDMMKSFFKKLGLDKMHDRRCIWKEFMHF